MTNSHDTHDRPSLSRRTLLTGAVAGGAGLAATLVEASPVAAAISPGSGPVDQGTAAAKPPKGALTFELTGPDIGTIVFQAMSGPASAVTLLEADEVGGTGPIFGRFLGRAEPPSVTLARSLTPGLELDAWHALARTGAPTAFKDTVLVVFSADQKPVARYVLVNAWPSKLEIGAGPERGAEALTETVTLHCAELLREAV
jgi:phage tail-like protein